MEKKKILVVDDEESVRGVLRDALESFEYNVVLVSGGAEALEVLTTEEFDLVIIDLMMPGMSGAELLEKIREFYSDLLVIVITGYGTEEIWAKINALGVSGYLGKPFKLEELKCLVGGVFSKKEPEDQA